MSEKLSEITIYPLKFQIECGIMFTVKSIPYQYSVKFRIIGVRALCSKAP